MEVFAALCSAGPHRVITKVTSIGVLVTTLGLCLTATVTGSYNAKAFVVQDVPLVVVAGGPLLEY